MVPFSRKIVLLAILFATFSNGFGQTLESSNLPILIIDTKGQEIPNEPKIIATIKIIDNGAGKRNTVTDQPTYAGKIGIEQRGSTSRMFFPKKPYGFELRDTSGIEGISASVLGLPSEEDWVLNATFNDKTLLRDVLTYDLYRSYSPYYAPQHKFCEVIINGTYEGIYILFEKIKRDKNRVNISKLEPKDNLGDALTGGYILKIDKTEGNVSRQWTSPYLPPNSPQFTTPIQVEYPKFEDMTEPQFEYIKKYVTDFENTLKSPAYADSAQGYARYIDVNSWVDYLILSEVCRNVDAYRLSTFFYKDKDSKGGKLTMGPIWDYNLAYGNADYCNGEKTEGWAFDFNRVCPNDGFQMPFWWDRLLEDRNFARKVRLRYQALRPTVLKTETIHRYIDSTATVLQEARVRNFTRWTVIGQKLWPNFYVGSTYEDEVGYLKAWITRRLAWMDQELMTFGADITATEPTVLPFQFSVFPNPASTEVQVSFRLDHAAVVKVQVYDLWGRVLREGTPGYLAPGDHLVTQSLPTSSAEVQFLGLEVDGKRMVVRKILRE
ncbi:CotH kinase family protein [Salmonirosea aquatica]|uniref:Spore coat protein CotH n=1 Tax=Salmonirosea aquatica TaxID=2654236 RepID=A0A7C9BCE6_9BACT|nr:spore coat protein CotH [Cytophagaceae bacterium SJW1-29]